jgi:hypothetical protein
MHDPARERDAARDSALAPFSRHAQRGHSYNKNLKENTT